MIMKYIYIYAITARALRAVFISMPLYICAVLDNHSLFNGMERGYFPDKKHLNHRGIYFNILIFTHTR